MVTGGAALDWRLAQRSEIQRARTTVDLDFLYHATEERAFAELMAATQVDLHDYFEFRVGPRTRPPEPERGSMRYHMVALLGAVPYLDFAVDIGVLDPLRWPPDQLLVSAVLDDPDFGPLHIPALPIPHQLAEKVHALTRTLKDGAPVELAAADLMAAEFVMSKLPATAPEIPAPLEALQAFRLKRHRLEPSCPLRTARAAAQFVKERGLVMATGRSSLPTLAEAIVGHHIVGSWMKHPQTHRIYRILREIPEHDILECPLVLGKHVLMGAALGPSVERVATDPERQANARAALSPIARTLLQQVESRGRVRMDRWCGPAGQARQARLILERELLVVCREVHTERGYHTSVIVPWRASDFSRRFSREATGLTLDGAKDQLLLAAVRSAIVVPEKEARHWFVFGGDRIAPLLASGGLERLVAQGSSWLTYRGASRMHKG